VINPVMFKEWCEEIHRANGNVLAYFHQTFVNRVTGDDLSDIEERIEYIRINYGEGNNEMPKV
jgi:hypothetical protein